MNFTYTPWLCTSYSIKRGTQDCAEQYDGYGAESYHTENYDLIPCEVCGGQDYFLMRYRIPEKNIIFLQNGTVKIDGKLWVDSNNCPYVIRYRGPLKREMSTWELTKAAGYNIRSEEDWWINFGAWENTITLRLSDDLIPDDIFEAYRIFIGPEKPLRRAIYRSRFVSCSLDDPDALVIQNGAMKQIDKRVEYY